MIKKSLSSWWQRFEAFSYWMGDDFERPIVNFSFEVDTVEIRPMAFFSSNDTNRWRLVSVNLYISRRWFHLAIPFKKLPDYTPNERQLRRRNGTSKL